MTEWGLLEFDPNVIPVDAVTIFIAKRGTGKSECCEDILYHMRSKIPTVLVFSPTEQHDGFYKKIIPHSFIYDKLDLDVLERLRERQAQVKLTQMTDSQVLCIFDNCFEKKSLWASNIIRSLILNGRHDNIGVMILAQYSLDLPPYLRSNVDFVFAFKDSYQRNRENLFKQYFGVVPSFKDFDPLMNYYTEDLGILVLNNKEKSNELKKCLFWYKPKKLTGPNAAIVEQ
jgi:hypothetical protein